MDKEAVRRLKVTEDLIEEENENPLSLTPEEVIASIKAAKASLEGPKKCACSNCVCGKK